MHCEPITKPSQVAKDDVVIAIMGPTGAGKSNFIDTITKQTRKRAGSGLASCTNEVSAIRIKDHVVYANSIVLLDTPGFDDTNKTDLEILTMISRWLVDMYKNNITLTGILYMHRITDNRMAGTPHRNLRMFGELCGSKAARNVFLVTTMWDELKKRPDGFAREDELKKIYWRPMMENGATTIRFENTSKSAGIIVQQVMASHYEGVATLLQEEMVSLSRDLKETTAGRELLTTLQTLLFKQKETVQELAAQAEAENDSERAKKMYEEMRVLQGQLKKTSEEVTKLRISLGRKFLLFFGKKPKSLKLAK